MERYDTIGRLYSRTRRPDPRIVGGISVLLKLPPGACLADIGAGTGNYTNALAEIGFRVNAVEPSLEMRAQAEPHAGVAWLDGIAEKIPLPDGSVDGIVSTLACHHFTSFANAAAEMHRICPTGPVVIFTLDPREGDQPWFGDYFPEIRRRDFEIFPPVGELAETLADQGGWRTDVTPFPLPSDLTDLFGYAGWNRPELYLDQTFRANTSGFALTDPAVIDRRVARLRDDLESGAWDEKHGQLRRESAFDAGFLFISCRD